MFCFSLGFHFNIHLIKRAQSLCLKIRGGAGRTSLLLDTFINFRGFIFHAVQCPCL